MSSPLTAEETHKDVVPFERTIGGTIFSPLFDIWETTTR